MTNLSTKFLVNSRLLAILCLGFASGLPLALTGSTLQAWFTEAHVDLMTIGALSLIGIPYSLKFLWAPLMDHFSFPLFGKRIGWILLAQVGLVITLFLLANLNPSTQAGQMGLIALAVAFFSASQDISITAYQTDVLHSEERGLGAAYYVFAYRIAGLLSGGLALISAAYLGWKITYEIMAGLIVVCILTTYFSPRAVEFQQTSKNVFGTTIAAMLDLFSRERIILILLFIVLYKLGDAFALLLMTNFLLQGLGFTLTEVGVAYKIVSVVGTIAGVFLGGLILTRWNIYRALFTFGLSQAFSNLMFAILAMAGKVFSLMALSVFIENFCTGMSTAALLAFMMSLCDNRYTASQFAILSGLSSIGRVYLGPVASFLVSNIGWTEFFVTTFVLSLPGIICLMLLKEKVLIHAQATST